MTNKNKHDISQDPNEQEWWDNYDPGKYQSPRIAVDAVILTIDEGSLHAVLVRREHYPEKGLWALPGVFVRATESLDEAARRALLTKAHLDNVDVEQLYTFGSPDRDPRARVISVTYYALVAKERVARLAKEPGVSVMRIEVPWAGELGGAVHVFDEDEQVELAFDHDEILGVCIKRLRGKIDYAPLSFSFLPEKFTLRDLQDVYHAVLGHSVNKDSFRRKILQSGTVVPTGANETETRHRPAELYRFKPQTKGAKNG